MEEEFQTGYQALQGFSEQEDNDDEVEDLPPGHHDIRVLPDKNRARWNHIENLDDFFTRIYQYHQRSGFACMVLQDILQLVQFAFVVMFTLFLLNCVDYDTLFYERWTNSSHKVSLADGIYPVNQCLARFGGTETICLIVAAVFWLFRLLKVIYHILKYFEIRAFYTSALKISATDLTNMTWHEVQKRLLEVQKDQQMCIHKAELSQLDIYHRILRFKNYMIAMVNKDLLPIKHRVPFLGNVTFLTTGLRYNIELLLFWGPWAPFENYWHLRSEYKSQQHRSKLADDLSRRILWVGVANFVLLPLIFLWQILYSFFRYAEMIRREPGALGARRWSMYSRLYLRHFNELEHEFTARLNRAYRLSRTYMDAFTSPLLTVVAKHLAFLAGSMLAVLIVLTLIDDDFLAVEHMLTIMSVLGATVAVCRGLIPDENMVWCPERLMHAVLAQIHYMPDSWKGSAHTQWVRGEFAQLFQYKAVYLLEELVSPLVTPFILCFGLRTRALAIVDFYRHHTVDVIGVGDVCAFAQMDIRKHGNPQWVPEEQTEASSHEQAEGGKVELSLLHFAVTNPEYKPPPESQAFMEGLRNQVQRDAAMMSLQPLDNPLATSLHSITGYGYTSILSSMAPGQSLYPMATSHMATSTRSAGAAVGGDRLPVRGGLRTSEGPYGGAVGDSSASSGGLLTSLQHSMAAAGSQSVGPGSVLAPSLRSSAWPGAPPGGSSVSALRAAPVAGGAGSEEGALEYLSQDMGFSALYLHAVHDRRLLHPLSPYFDDDDARQRQLWSTDGASATASAATGLHLHDQAPAPQSRVSEGLGRLHDLDSPPPGRGLADTHPPPSSAAATAGHFAAQTEPLPQLPGPYGSRMPNIPEVGDEELIQGRSTSETRPLISKDSSLHEL